jgi:hypothetical protein
MHVSLYVVQYTNLTLNSQVCISECYLVLIILVSQQLDISFLFSTNIWWQFLNMNFCHNSAPHDKEEKEGRKKRKT